MRFMILFAGFLSLLAVSSLGSAGQRSTSASASTSTSAPSSSLESLAFLQGTWRGFMGQAEPKEPVEEIWSAPQGDNIMGCFRWSAADGAIRMLEMLSISKESDAIRLRLRHYAPTLTAKEEADKPITLKLSVSEPNRAVFVAEKDAGSLASISYALVDGALKIDITFAQEPANESAATRREPLSFTLTRQRTAS